MPLSPADEKPVARLLDVSFTMMDGERRVACADMRTALDALEPGIGLAEETLRRFERHAARIYSVASAKYDAGNHHPLLGRRDLMTD